MSMVLYLDDMNKWKYVFENTLFTHNNVTIQNVTYINANCIKWIKDYIRKI